MRCQFPTNDMFAKKLSVLSGLWRALAQRLRRPMKRVWKVFLARSQSALSPPHSSVPMLRFRYEAE